MNGLALARPLILAFQSLIADLVLPMRRQRRRQARRGPGRVSLVGAGPGSADLITMRGLSRLRDAEVVFYDRLADPALLGFCRPDARLVNVGKSCGHHPVPQERINRLLVEAALAGWRVVRLKCGDPGIFGRGAEEADACAGAGIEVEIVPGVTSASAAAAAAGGFLTERGQTDRVLLVTGHNASGPKADWRATAAPGTTLVIYMGLSSLGRIAVGLAQAGWPGDAPVEIVANAQAPGQSVLRTTLAALPSLPVPRAAEGPATVLVRWPAGPAVASAQAIARPEAASAG